MTNIKNGLKALWVEILIALFLLVFIDDVRWFLAFFFIEVLFTLWAQTDYLRKIIRIFNLSTETKIIAISKKLDVTNEDIEQIAKENKEKVGAEKWKQIEEELIEVINN